MHISVHTTKNASAYHVLLDGVEVEGWIEADDTAGYVLREVRPTSGAMRFLRQERVTGAVTITPPLAESKV